MNLTITCPACKRSLTVPAHYAGTTGHCTHCRAPITIPPMASTSAPPLHPPQIVQVEPKSPVLLGFRMACGCFLFILFLLGCLFTAINWLATMSGHPLEEAATLKPEHATLSEYNALYEGMTYGQACQTIGAPGTPGSSHSSAYGTSQTYTWHGPGPIPGNVTASFTDDRLTSKIQIGLK